MSNNDFRREKGDMDAWLSGLVGVWMDGKKETDDIITEWTDAFKGLTQNTRGELQEMKAAADGAGLSSVSDQISGDIAALDAMDAEIEKLLKKRKNRKLTDQDQARLRQLIETREAIEIKYHLTAADTDGFEDIRRKIEAEIARAQALGKTDIDVAVYENAMVGAAKGMAVVTDEINAQYDKEYELIKLIENETERQTALDALNAKYSENRRAAALEYAQTLAGVVMPVWEQEDIQKADADIDALTQKLREYSAATESEKPGLLAELNELTAGMDEGAVTEYIALLTQVQSLMDSGMSEEEVQAMFPEIDFSKQLEQIASIQTFLQDRETLLPGLAGMFGEALKDEVLKIATDLDMTGAQARWDVFAADPGAITTAAIVSGYTDAPGVTPGQPTVEAFIAKYTEIPEGADKASLTPAGLVAYVSAYAEITTGASVTSLNPANITAMVSAYRELAAGADITALKPEEITAYINAYLEKEGVDTASLKPSDVTAFVLAYAEITGGALTTALTPTDIAATVTKYLQAEGVDISELTPDQINALVSAYAEATGCDKSALKAEVVAQITAYEEAEGVQKPSFIRAQIAITGYDLMAYRRFVKDNPVHVAGIVRLGATYENPSDALLDPQAVFWQDGVEVPASAVPEDKLTPDSVAVLDEDGTMHILLTPELTGSEEAISALREEIARVDQFGVTELGKTIGLVPTTTLGLLDSAMGRIKSYEKTMNRSAWDKFWAAVLHGESTDLGILGQSMELDFTPERVAEMTAYVQEVVTAIQNGGEVSEDDMANMRKMVEFLNGLETLGIGENITAGIGDALVAMGWETDAESVAANLENALNAAFQIHSPSERMKPLGDGATAGIGAGIAAYSMTADAAALASNAESALKSAMPVSVYRSIGLNAMNGITAGIVAGRSGVVYAMRSAARAAVNAAKSELLIRSPSRVFRDEIGRMTMRGFGEGVLLETKEQARAITNAARYLSGEAKESAIGYATSDNRKTYNQQSSVNLTGNSFYIRDEQDITALAVEIAALTKRQQRGRGLRFA